MSRHHDFDAGDVFLKRPRAKQPSAPRKTPVMKPVLRWAWNTGIISTFLAGLFALLPIVITLGIMAWAGGFLKTWLGPESFVGQALFHLGLRFVTNPAVASILGWSAVLLSIWLLGALLKSVGKKRIEKMFHTMMERIPLVNVLYGTVAQVVEMFQRDPTDKLQGMSVVYCGVGRERGAGFLALLASEQVYQFNGQTCQIVYVPTSPLPMSGLVVFAATDTVTKVDMQVDDLMKICLSIGVMSSKVIPDQYILPPESLRRSKEGSDRTPAVDTTHRGRHVDATRNGANKNRIADWEAEGGAVR